MIVTPYKTRPVVAGDTLYPILDTYLPRLHERDIVVVTSKIVSICEGSVVKIHDSQEKQDLIRKQSQYYIDNELTRRYGFQLTIANNMCIPNAGIDESNGNGFTILWPKNPMQSAKKIWNHLRTKNSIKFLGVIISDSHTTMLRYGITGIGLAWCGFQALKNYIGTPDIFHRKLRVTKSHLLDGLAASAVLVMGEGNEQTPLAVIQEARNIVFTDHSPTKEEIENMYIPLKQDMYAPLLMDIPWQKGGKK